MATQLVTAFSDSRHDYWAMHFAAVLECLDDHKGMQSDPHASIDVNKGDWTLAGYRGVAGSSAFVNIEEKVQNFGAQYLLADLLNRKESNLGAELISHLEDLHDAELLGKPLDSLTWDCYVAGEDSRAGDELAEKTNARLLGDRRHRAHTYDEVGNTDLCLVLQDTSPETNMKPLAILGEVEGNNGHKLTRASFWADKPDLAQFGIGLVEDVSEEFEILPLVRKDGSKVVVRMDHEESVLADFHKAVDKVRYMMRTGPKDRWWESEPEALRDILDLLANSFMRRVGSLLDSLRTNTIITDLDVETLGQVDLLSTTPDIIAPPGQSVSE